MDLTSLTDEQLKTELTTWAARVAAGEARLLALIGELDAREAWGEHGVASCAHWLSWRLGYSATTSRERVRVARALRDLPQVASGLAEGRLSYAQARAISRVATRQDEAEWVALATHCTAAQLDKAAGGAARARAASSSPESPARSSMRVRWNDDGSCTITATLPAEVAPAVLDALEEARRAEQRDREERLAAVAAEVVADVAPGAASAEAPAEVPQRYEYVEPDYPLHLKDTPRWEEALEAWTQERDRRRALRDAWRDHEEAVLAAVAARYVPTGPASLADGLIRLALRPDQVGKVVVKLQHDPVTGWSRTLDDVILPPATLEAMRGLLRVQDVGGRTALSAHDQGRRTRTASPALRSVLGRLDGERCRFPGCDRTRFLHAHHVVHWADGGGTDLHNLVLVCGHHHRHLHDHGYQLALHPDRRLEVRTSDGTAIAPRVPLPRASAEALPEAAARTTPTGGPFDLGYVVNVMLAHAA